MAEAAVDVATETEGDAFERLIHEGYVRLNEGSWSTNEAARKWILQWAQWDIVLLANGDGLVLDDYTHFPLWVTGWSEHEVALRELGLEAIDLLEEQGAITVVPAPDGPAPGEHPLQGARIVCAGDGSDQLYDQLWRWLIDNTPYRDVWALLN